MIDTLFEEQVEPRRKHQQISAEEAERWREALEQYSNPHNWLATRDDESRLFPYFNRYYGALRADYWNGETLAIPAWSMAQWALGEEYHEW